MDQSSVLLIVAVLALGGFVVFAALFGWSVFRR
jgi:hypothetical protein